MKERAEGLKKIAVTGDAPQLPPGTASRMAVGPEIAPAAPAPRGTVRVGAELPGGVHLAVASPGGHEAGWRGTGGLWMAVAGLRTEVTMRLCGQACKGLALTLALGHWGCGLWGRQTRGGAAGPRPLEQEAQPHQSNQH
jgi:hypothetical protein